MLGSYFGENRRQTSNKKFIITVVGVVALVGFLGSIAIISSPSPRLLSVLQAEESEFHEFMASFDKVYKGEEYHSRFKKFRDNLAYIRLFNSLENSVILGVNQFADMDFVEFKETYYPESRSISTEDRDSVSDFTATTKIDWRTLGAVTPVKNQGQCGSCWSFAATGTMEGAWFIAKKSLVSLSEQQLIDCSGAYGNAGCNGGLEYNGFRYVIANKGITSQSNYPYTAANGSCNNSKASQVVTTLTSFKYVTANDPTSLKAAVALRPVAIGVQASQTTWQLYKSGTITTSCGTNLDHSVMIVGYDATVATPYWIVKNSWGTSWGLSGYVQIAITSGNGVCGVNMDPSYPIV